MRAEQIHMVHWNANHAQILWPCAQELRSRGLPVETLINTDAPRHHAAETFFAQKDVPFRRIGWQDIQSLAAPGHVVIMPLLGPVRHYVESVQSAGGHVLQIMEGAGAAARNRTDANVPLLGWGPAITRSRTQEPIIVGAPVLEAAMARGRGTPEGYALINAKFGGGITVAQGMRWLEAALAACAQARVPAVVSAHSSERPTILPGDVRDTPVRDLLRHANLLLSRPSTVVFEALVIDVPVLLVPEGDERLVEFKNPKGAYPIFKKWEKTPKAIRQFVTGRTRPDTRAFLDRNLHIDPKRSAVDRIADEIAARVGQIHPLAAIAP